MLNAWIIELSTEYGAFVGWGSNKFSNEVSIMEARYKMQDNKGVPR
jgi:hypothetical protein